MLKDMFSNFSKDELVKEIGEYVISKLSNITDKNSKTKDELLTGKEVQDLLKISHVTLWNWVKKGRIASYKVGSQNRYKREDVNGLLKEVEAKRA